MPAVKKQRRGAAVPKTKPSQESASTSISSFTRVSKSVGNANIKKEDTIAVSTPKKAVKLEAITPASRKRKVVASIEDDSSSDERPTKTATSPAKKSTSTSTSAATTTTTTPAKRGRGRPPKKQRPEPTPRKRGRSPSASDTDVSGFDVGTLKKLRLESPSPLRFSTPLTADTSVAGSDIEPDTTNPSKSGELPAEVLSLIDLHAAFLKTLSLHYAHNGTNVPADLRLLSPNIARAWGRKKVTDAEIRICLGVLDGPLSSTLPSSSPFTLINYGRGKICVETKQAGTFGPLNETKLNALFRANIKVLWSGFSRNSEHGDDNSGASSFASTLPKAPITLCESVAKASPLLLKGQQRLEDLKHGIAVKKVKLEKPYASVTTTSTLAITTSSSTSQTNSSSSSTTTPAAPQKLSLLDRIRLKSQQKLSAPPGLSAAQLSRRAALQRTEEVASLIGMLSRASSSDSTGGRISFAMSALIQTLKDSFRMGISKPEGADCVRLLAAEVAPEWLRIVTLNGKENVVVETGCEVGKPEVARRVRGILEREE